MTLLLQKTEERKTKYTGIAQPVQCWTESACQVALMLTTDNYANNYQNNNNNT